MYAKRFWFLGETSDSCFLVESWLPHKHMQHNVLDLSFYHDQCETLYQCTEIQLLFMVFDLRKYKATFSTKDWGCKTFLLQTAVVAHCHESHTVTANKYMYFTVFFYFFEKQCFCWSSNSVTVGRFLRVEITNKYLELVILSKFNWALWIVFPCRRFTRTEVPVETNFLLHYSGK